MERLIKLAAETLDIDEKELTLESAAEELEEWDSVAHINMVSEVEEEFGVTIPIDDITKITKVKDFLKYIEGK
ncbi:MAG: acyl carrier protein [bacterium]|nr:acyl carrier protein [bacterium]